MSRFLSRATTPGVITQPTVPQLRRRRGGRTQLQMLLLRIARLLLLVWLADALHVRMSAATNPNQWREFRKDQIVQQRAESPTPPMSTPTTVSRGH